MCAIVAREHLSLRVDPETKSALEREASSRRIAKTALAEQFLREGIRMAVHPGIVFRDGPAGRRPGLVGGPDVWEVVMVWSDSGRSSRDTADILGLPIGLVNVATGYYADYQTEIDDWIYENRRVGEQAEAAWRRRQALSAM